MNGQNQENLKELFEQFFPPDQAASVLNDLQVVRKMLRENPAPEPERQLIAAIKYDIGQALAAPKRVWTFRTLAYRVAVAAAIIIVAAIGTQFLKKGPEKPSQIKYASIIPRAIWDSNDITVADADLAVLTAEVQQIEDEVQALQSGEKRRNGEGLIVEVETELIEIAGDFWKG